MRRLVYRTHRLLNKLLPTWPIGRDTPDYHKITCRAGEISFWLNFGCFAFFLKSTHLASIFLMYAFALLTIINLVMTLRLRFLHKPRTDVIEATAYSLLLQTPARMMIETVLDIIFFIVKTWWMAIHPYKLAIQQVKKMQKTYAKANKPLRLDADFATFAVIQQIEEDADYYFEHGYASENVGLNIQEEFERYLTFSLQTRMEYAEQAKVTT